MAMVLVCGVSPAAPLGRFLLDPDHPKNELVGANAVRCLKMEPDKRARRAPALRVSFLGQVDSCTTRMNQARGLSDFFLTHAIRAMFAQVNGTLTPRKPG
jgi:hypothetical protein